MSDEKIANEPWRQWADRYFRANQADLKALRERVEALEEAQDWVDVYARTNMIESRLQRLESPSPQDARKDEELFPDSCQWGHPLIGLQAGAECPLSEKHTPRASSEGAEEAKGNYENCICAEYDGKGRSTCGFPCPVHPPRPSSSEAKHDKCRWCEKDERDDHEHGDHVYMPMSIVADMTRKAGHVTSKDGQAKPPTKPDAPQSDGKGRREPSVIGDKPIKVIQWGDALIYADSEQGRELQSEARGLPCVVQEVRPGEQLRAVVEGSERYQHRMNGWDEGEWDGCVGPKMCAGGWDRHRTIVVLAPEPGDEREKK